MGKKAAIVKYSLLAALVLGTAGAAGHFAALHYQATLAVVQQHQAEKQAARQAAQEKRAQREKKSKPVQQPDATASAGKDATAEGLTSDMRVKDIGNGRTLYSYDPPTQDGVYIVPYLVKKGDQAILYISVRHLGQRAIGFVGVDVQTGSSQVFQIRAEEPVATETREGGGIVERFDQPVNVRTLTALRTIGESYGGAHIAVPIAGGSNDDRMMTAMECLRCKNMVELFDTWRRR